MAARKAGIAGNNRKAKDMAMAAMFKAKGVVRTTQRCPVCYHIIACESVKSRYSHLCR